MPIQANRPITTTKLADFMARPAPAVDLTSGSFEALILSENSTAEARQIYASLWKNLSPDQLQAALDQGMTPTSNQLQALIQTWNPEIETLLTIILDAWPEATPLELGNSLDEHHYWRQLSPTSLALLLNHGMVPTLQQIQALSDSWSSEKTAMLPLMIKALPKELSSINGKAWNHPWYWASLSQEDLLYVLAQGLTPTSKQLQALTQSGNPETETLLKVMLEAWPDATPIGMGDSLDFAHGWKNLSPGTLHMLLDRDLVVPTSKQLQALLESFKQNKVLQVIILESLNQETILESQETKNDALLKVMLQAWPEATPVDVGDSLDQFYDWNFSHDSLALLLKHGMVPTPQQIQALANSWEEEKFSMLQTMIDALPKEQSSVNGEAWNYPWHWAYLSQKDLLHAQTQGWTPTSRQLQALIQSGNPEIHTMLKIMLDAWPDATPIDVGDSLDHHHSWKNLSPETLHMLLGHKLAVPTSKQLQALIESWNERILFRPQDPEYEKLLTLMLDAWPDATPIDVSDILDGSSDWRNLSPDSLALLLDHGLVPTPQQIQALSDSWNRQKSSMLPKIIEALPKKHSGINGEAWNYPWHWTSLSPEDLLHAQTQGLTPTSRQFQALIQSGNPETQTLLKIMLDAWPDATPIDIVNSLDYDYIWETLSPGSFQVLLDHGLADTLLRLDLPIIEQLMQRIEPSQPEPPMPPIFNNYDDLPVHDPVEPHEMGTWV
jgi:DNA-binding phage protein